MVAKRKYKLDLFPLLRNISTKNVGHFDTLTEENLKEFNAYLLMRWLAGCNDGKRLSARQICFLNGFVNPYVWHFDTKDRRHKKLLYNLLTVCTSGRDCSYTFNKTKGKRQSTMPLATKILQEIFSYSSLDAFDAIPSLSNESIIEMAEYLGRQDGEIKLLKKELKTKRKI